MRIVIIGSGIAGSEAGTYLGYRARRPLEVIEIECEPARRFGGWGFQRFPLTQTTNLATRKMYLGEDPQEIFRWLEDPDQRAQWPDELQASSIHPDRPLPRALIQRYVMWRREQVDNDLVTYHSITGEAMRVHVEGDRISVELRTGARIEADRLVMASGSIAVKIPAYLLALQDHDRVIIDPLTIEGHERREEIPTDARVLILGTGLTGEEQVNILYARGCNRLTMLSRQGHRHYTYRQDQNNIPLVLDEPPDFLRAETPEEFDDSLIDFYDHFLQRGHSQEDILAALRPHWDQMRAELGGCYSAADKLRRFRRSLAVNSIGSSFEVTQNLERAEEEGALTGMHGYIRSVTEEDGEFVVRHASAPDASEVEEARFDYIINAIGRNIIRHPIWETLLEEGIASKHAGIGVRVSHAGQLVDSEDNASDLIWVVGMARAGDHALRHGFLGNTAFNLPQVRSHLYETIDAMLDGPKPEHKNKLAEALYLLEREGIEAKLRVRDESLLVWAVSEGYGDIALALIEAGANVNASNSLGNTPLIRSACTDRLALTRALIEAGADLDRQNADGYSALILASRRGNEEVVEMLLEAGADRSLTTRWGFSFEDPGTSPKSPLTGPRDPTLEAKLLEAIRARAVRT